MLVADDQQALTDPDLKPQERIVLNFLKRNPGREFTREDFEDALYGGRKDGGPDGAPDVVRQILHGLRSKGISVRKRIVYSLG